MYAPADGFVVMIAHRTQPPGTTEKKREYDDYALYVEHAVGFYTFFDLLTALDPVLTKNLDDATKQRFAKRQQGPPVHIRVPVKAGQALGKVAGRSLDFAAINAETRLKGFLSPEVYGHYAWRVHVVDPFDHFEGELKASLLKLNPRTAEPRGGRIDFDIDGRLSGNWFKDGTGGYPGTRDPRGYWMGHLAFVRHHLDADAVIVSVGDFDGKPRQFGVKGNGPDPAKVAKADGAVKYELVEMTRPSSDKPFEGATGKVVGVLLAEVQDGRALKVEVFPGATGADVKGFTAKAAVYRR